MIFLQQVTKAFRHWYFWIRPQPWTFCWNLCRAGRQILLLRRRTLAPTIWPALQQVSPERRPFLTETYKHFKMCLWNFFVSDALYFSKNSFDQNFTQVLRACFSSSNAVDLVFFPAVLVVLVARSQVTTTLVIFLIVLFIFKLYFIWKNINFSWKNRQSPNLLYLIFDVFIVDQVGRTEIFVVPVLQNIQDILIIIGVLGTDFQNCVMNFDLKHENVHVAK